VRRLVLRGAALVMLACSACATAVTGSPTSISDDRATVAGQVINDVGILIEYWAEYGSTTAYGSETAHEFIGTPDYTLQSVSVRIEGLQPSTSYHYRVCAQDTSQQGGPGCGEDRRFTTQSVGCGDTLTADLRLTADLNCEGLGTAFVIGAPGIEVDLAGHTVSGNAGAGLDNSAGFDDLVVRDGSVAGFGNGIVVEGASRNRFLDVNASAPGTAILITGGERNEVRRSNLSGQFGLDVHDSDRLVVADSDVTATTLIAIRVDGDFARVVRNRTPTSGGPFSFPSGIQIAGNGNLVRRNRVEGPWKEGGGIGLLSGSDNSIVENEVSGGENDGILVGAFTAGTLLRGNFVHGNGDDGIDVQAPSARLKDNRADDNGDLGIDAVAGETDLGGNTASGNGNPLQCVNVFCP
jgi:hypothetical protein